MRHVLQKLIKNNLLHLNDAHWQKISPKAKEKINKDGILLP